MRSTWGPSGGDRTQVGPILAPWSLLSGILCKAHYAELWTSTIFYLRFSVSQFNARLIEPYCWASEWKRAHLEPIIALRTLRIFTSVLFKGICIFFFLLVSLINYPCVCISDWLMSQLKMDYWKYVCNFRIMRAKRYIYSRVYHDSCKILHWIFHLKRNSICATY